MAGVYSTRFFVAAGTGVMTTYNVPIGMRAVIRSLVALNETQANAEFFLYVKGVPFYTRRFPDAMSTHVVEMRQVAYGGEQIKCYTSHFELHVALSGYLFEDRAAAAEPEGEVTREHVDRPEQLPAGGT